MEFWWWRSQALDLVGVHTANLCRLLVDFHGAEGNDTWTRETFLNELTPGEKRQA